MKSLEQIDFNSKEFALKRRPITQEEIEATKTKKGAWVRSSLIGWGVPWPPPKGWRKAILKYGVPLFDFPGVKTNKAHAKISRRINAALPKKSTRQSHVASREDFYKSWEWRTLRMEVLKEHGARCQCCGASRDDMTMAGEPVRICVDHIKPLSKFWGLRLERSNLQVLCDECNQGKGAWDETDWRVDEAIRAQLRYQV